MQAHEITCESCGRTREFLTRADTRYCDDRCRAQAHRDRHPKTYASERAAKIAEGVRRTAHLRHVLEGRVRR